MAKLAQIAKAAGVSISTVSRVLNRRSGVNDVTRQRVLDVLADLPYEQRGLGVISTDVIGLLVPELGNPVFPMFAEAVETRAARAGLSVVLCNTRSASLRGEGYVRMLRSRGVAGMVFVSPETTDEGVGHAHYQRLLDDGVRMVFVNGQTPALDIRDISVDEQAAGFAATEHLVRLGHTRIGFVSGPVKALPTRLKRAGWAAALRRAGLPAEDDQVASAPFSVSGGASAFSRLLDTSRPTAVICSSDVMALGVLSEARRRGLSVPGDLSVVGFDDIPFAAYATPGLTTLAQPVAAMADSAVTLLTTMLREDADPGELHSRVFRPRLVVRESTAPPRP